MNNEVYPLRNDAGFSAWHSSLSTEQKTRRPAVWLQYGTLIAISLLLVIAPRGEAAPVGEITDIVETAIELDVGDADFLDEDWQQAAQPQDGQFLVRAGEQLSALPIYSVFVMPGEELTLAAEKPLKNANYTLAVEDGFAKADGHGRWIYEAPEDSGKFRVVIEQSLLTERESEGSQGVVQASSSRQHLINVFVLVDANQIDAEYLEGYRIGSYPDKPLRGLAAYRKPNGFVRVDQDNLDTRLTPHFTLRQFLCKQRDGYPKFVVLREPLLFKLEQVLNAAHQNGWPADSLHVMSGYRTPFYNRAIGNVKYSRHQWGGAADVFIDQFPRDGRMDDLNGDLKSDRKDAELMRDWVEALSSNPDYRGLKGGLGVYGPKPHRGPFVHVDVRGYKARW